MSRAGDTRSTSDVIRDLLGANPYWLAPMAGVTDPPFRAICRRLGAGLSYTEMVSAKGLDHAERSSKPQRTTPDGNTHHINNTERLLLLADGEKPSAVQLFGNEPEVLARQARRIAERLDDDLALIDLNAGCPVPKVFNRCEGSGLMADTDLTAQIVREMVAAVADIGVPITVKFRRGVSPDAENAVQFGLAVQEAGAAAVTVHGRFRSQYYKGESCRDSIARVKAALHIPVIASGDVMSAFDALAVRDETGADGVMVARGAMGNPWIFEQIAQLETARASGQPAPILEPVPAAVRFAVVREHAQGILDFFGPHSLVRMRRHVSWYCHGLPGSASFRREVNSITTMDDLEQLINRYEDYLADRERRFDEEASPHCSSEPGVLSD